MRKHIFTLLIVFISFTLLGIQLVSQDFDKEKLEFEININASPKEVYNAWTTTEGIKSFFAPDGKVELKMFGDYHIYFFPDAFEGSRGAEDEKIIGYEENKMISFTWGFPPMLPELRANQKTVVTIRFFETGSVDWNNMPDLSQYYLTK